MTKTQRRPNTGVPFYYELATISESFREYVIKNYNGTILKVTRKLSEDGLVLTTTTVCSSRKALLKYITDPHVAETMTIPAAEYESKNKIITVDIVTDTKED